MIEIVKDIVKFKTGNSLTRKDFGEVFSLYMVQRWATMYSDFNVEILNSTVNILYKSLDNEQHYKLMMEILPPNAMYGAYIKAPVKDKSKKKEDINISGLFEESSTVINDSLAYVFGEK